jgi:16S rRNA pseudouridine516 synthase
MKVSMRLDAFLSNAGVGSRSEVKKLIRKGRVIVDGQLTKDPQTPVDRNCAVVCDGVAVVRPPAGGPLALHKPAGFACSRSEEERPLVYHLLDPLLAKVVEPAGRLDRDTSGLLILSTDGGLIHRLIHPRKKLPKRYRIGYRGELAADAVERCAAGFALDDDPQPTAPAELALEAPAGDLQRATLILTEGRYHQVRRMIAALGGEVVELHRDRIGGLDLPAELAPGHSRELSPEELQALQQGLDS